MKENMMHANFVAGEWLNSAQSTPNVNPSNTDDIVGEFAVADEEAVSAACDAAAAAFPKWRASIQQRFDILDAAGNEILARREELGRLLAREEGKILPEAIGEVTRAGHIFKFFAGEAVRIAGDMMDSVRPGIEVAVTREPLGPIGIITPWNFPIAIPAWKIAPALAYGNTVVFKPADLVPGCAWAIVDILHRAGLPAGVLNLVMGRGSRIGPAIIENQHIRGVSFTGGITTGAGIAAACSKRGIKYQLEMGGKNPCLILDDADLKIAVDSTINSAFFSTGQRCTASSRLIVTEGIHDRFVGEMQARLATLKVGDAVGDGVHIGPVVDERQLGQDMDYIEIGQKEGATLAFGGERVECATPGFYLAPALFTGVSNSMRIAQEEIFGPVAAVIKVKDFEEGLALCNDTPFGLSAGICTSSLKHATQFRREAQAGMVMINLPTAGVDYHVPFGGVKGSSYGSREQGRYAMEFYTTVKTAYMFGG
jgi:alpha-ketoglutaric semialdehyde dehydrogenase